MATSAKTSFSVSLAELQVIATSLKLYQGVIYNMARKNSPLEGIVVELFLEDPRRQAIAVQKLRRDLGLLDIDL